MGDYTSKKDETYRKIKFDACRKEAQIQHMGTLAFDFKMNGNDYHDQECYNKGTHFKHAETFELKQTQKQR